VLRSALILTCLLLFALTSATVTSSHAQRSLSPPLDSNDSAWVRSCVAQLYARSPGAVNVEAWCRAEEKHLEQTARQKEEAQKKLEASDVPACSDVIGTLKRVINESPAANLGLLKAEEVVDAHELDAVMGLAPSKG
jgi:hypothetical protein